MKTTFAPEDFVSISIADSVKSAASTVKNFLRGRVCITVAVAATVIFLAALFAANSAITVASGLAALTAIAADTSDDSQLEEEGGEL